MHVETNADRDLLKDTKTVSLGPIHGWIRATKINQQDYPFFEPASSLTLIELLYHLGVSAGISQGLVDSSET